MRKDESQCYTFSPILSNFLLQLFRANVFIFEQKQEGSVEHNCSLSLRKNNFNTKNKI